MKKNMITIALTSALLSVSAAHATEFSGGWLGGKLGTNRASITGTPSSPAKSASTYGLEAGYNWDVGAVELGVDGFVERNSQVNHPNPSTHWGSNVYGLDAKLGLPAGNWLPYVKLGVARGSIRGQNLTAPFANMTGSGTGPHWGLGVEYKFAPQWSLAGEYADNKLGKTGNKIHNRNLTIGLNYYFNAPVEKVVVADVKPVAPDHNKKEIAEVPVTPPPPPPPPPAPCKDVTTDKVATLSGANFATGSAKLNASAEKQLKAVTDLAAAKKEAKLVVSGHTDDKGSDTANLKLSEKRAESVKAYLVKKGVAANRIVTKGYGEAKPIGDNKTKAGRDQNRRVEIVSISKETNKVCPK